MVAEVVNNHHRHLGILQTGKKLIKSDGFVGSCKLAIVEKLMEKLLVVCVNEYSFMLLMLQEKLSFVISQVWFRYIASISLIHCIYPI